jgi:hypothetical protein
VPAIKADGVNRHDVEEFLEAKRRKLEPRTTSEMIDAVLIELNRQLEPLLEISRLRIMDQEQLDRMIGINTAVLAIHRALGPGEVDPSTFTDEQLRRVAK